MSNAYVINFTDRFSDPGNKEKFTIQPFTTNGTLFPTDPILDPRSTDASTSLLLVGKGITDYGERLQENIVHLLEHFAGDGAPVNPTKGQLWYFVKAANVAFTELRVYNPAIGTAGSGGENWEAVQFIQTQQPGNPIVGETWYDQSPIEPELATTGTQLKVWNNLTWISVAANYLPLIGGTLTGHLTLPSGPSAAQAVRRDFVELLTNALDTRLDALETGGLLEALRINGTNQMTGNLNMGNTRLVNLSSSVVATDGVNQGQVVLRTGANTMTGPLNLGNNQITNLAAGTLINDATRVDQVLQRSGESALTANFMTGVLNLNGFKIINLGVSLLATDATTRQEVLLLDGTQAMLGNLDVGGFVIVNLADPIISTDAATKNYVDTNLSGFLKTNGTNSMLANLNANAFNVINLAAPVNPADATTKQYVDDLIAGIPLLSDNFVTSGSIDTVTNNVTLVLAGGAPDVLITNISPADHKHVERGETIPPLTIPHTVIYRIQGNELGDDLASPFNFSFATYSNGMGGPFDAFPYVPLRNILHYIDRFKAQRDDGVLGGTRVTLLPGTTIRLGGQPSLLERPFIESDEGEVVVGRDWTFLRERPTRTVATAIAAQTVFTAPAHVVGTNHLMVFVNGIKKYRNQPARQVIDYGGTIDSEDATGLANNTTTYKATVTTSPGAVVTHINVRGQDAQTFRKLLNYILFTHHLTITSINTVVSGSHSFTIPGDFTELFPTGLSIRYDAAGVPPPENEGTYTVRAPGATFAAGITTVPIFENFLAPLFPLDNIRFFGERSRFDIELRSKTGLSTESDIIFESYAVGPTATISIADVGPNPLFASIGGFIAIDPAAAGATVTGGYGDAPIATGNIGYRIVFNAGLAGGEVVEITSLTRHFN